ncbi:HAD family hydrolase [Pseudomonas sp. B22129]|uniref:HAD family hydrolase n=1 Tax=Pseudomonas sp. B22129 TaxID=3235111 RepID=UPI0037850540
MNIIFDLDGTLIDSKARLHRLFQLLVPQSTLTFDQYWDFKFSGLSNETIVSNHFGFDERKVVEFRQEWMDLIESQTMLEIDTNFSGMHQALEELKRSATLHVCTARQHVSPVFAQLESLGLLEYFTNVMITEQNKSKESLIIQNVSNLTPGDWMIGDTGKDIQVGQALGIKTCAVLTGFMTTKALSGYRPSLILESVVDFRL